VDLLVRAQDRQLVFDARGVDAVVCRWAAGGAEAPAADAVGASCWAGAGVWVAFGVAFWVDGADEDGGVREVGGAELVGPELLLFVIEVVLGGGVDFLVRREEVGRLARKDEEGVDLQSDLCG